MTERRFRRVMWRDYKCMCGTPGPGDGMLHRYFDIPFWHRLHTRQDGAGVFQSC